MDEEIHNTHSLRAAGRINEKNLMRIFRMVLFFLRPCVHPHSETFEDLLIGCF